MESVIIYNKFKVAEAQWTTKPLKAVEKASEVDALYVKSIQKRLELLNSAKA